MAAKDTNSAPTIRRVRRVGDQLHITFTDGRPRLDVPAAVNGPYQSRASYGYRGGVYTAERAV